MISAGFLGIENGKWKWKCLACKVIFYGEPGKAVEAMKEHTDMHHRCTSCDGTGLDVTLGQIGTCNTCGGNKIQPTSGTEENSTPK
mgnify:CR=1 FL=1